MARLIFTLLFFAVLAVGIFYALNLFSTSFVWNAVVAVLVTVLAYIGFKAWREHDISKAFEDFQSFIGPKVENNAKAREFIRNFANGLQTAKANKDGQKRREVLKQAKENFINFLMEDEKKTRKEAEKEVNNAFRDWRTATSARDKDIYLDYIRVMGDGKENK